MRTGWLVWTALAVLALFGATEPASASCTARTTTSDLADAAKRAEEALANADADAYRAADDAIAGLLPCVDMLVPVTLAAMIHRTGGVRAFLDRDLERAQVRFATARYLEPGYVWPVEMLPASHPIRTAYMEHVLTGLEIEVPPRPRRGVLAVDGRIGRGRLYGLPSILQLVGNDGVPEFTQMVAPFESLPEFDVGRSGSLRVSTVGSIAAAVGAGIFYGAAMNARSTYNDLDTPYSELDGHRQRITGYSIASGTFATVAVGVGIIAILPRKSR